MPSHAYASRKPYRSAQKQVSRMSRPMDEGKQRSFSQFPPWILKSLHLFHGVQLKIVSLIVYKNGFDDPSREFSVRYIASKIAEPRSTVHLHLRKLIESGFVSVKGQGRRKIQKLDVPWQSPFESAVMPEKVISVRPVASDRTVQVMAQSVSRQCVQVLNPVPVHKSVPVPSCWLKAKELLLKSIPDPMYQTFIEPLEARESESGIVLTHSNPQTIAHLRQRYDTWIDEILRSCGSSLAGFQVLQETAVA